MDNVNIATLRSLRQSLEGLLVPLSAQLEGDDSGSITAQNALDLIVGDLTMVALILTNVDLRVTPDELDLLNGIRQAVYGDEISLLTSEHYEDLCRQFLHLYPRKRLTIDALPKSIMQLEEYDSTHGTCYSDKARTLFLEFAGALVIADKNRDSVESITLLNFRDILYPPATSA